MMIAIAIALPSQDLFIRRFVRPLSHDPSPRCSLFSIAPVPCSTWVSRSPSFFFLTNFLNQITKTS